MPGLNDISDADLMAELAGEAAPELDETVVGTMDSDTPPSEPTDPAGEAEAQADTEPVVDEPTEDDEALATIEKRDAYQREKLEAERERMLADVKAEREKMEADFRSQLPPELLSAAKELRLFRGPDGALDYKQAAAHFLMRHKANEGDPRYAEIASRSIRERELQERIDRLESRFKTQDERATESKQAAENERKAQEWLTVAEKSAETKAPTVAKWLAGDREGAQVAIMMEAARIKEETGELPSQAKAIESLEKRKVKELGLFGITNGTATKTVAKTDQTTTTAADQSAVTTGTDTSNPNRFEHVKDPWERQTLELIDELEKP